MRLSPRLRTRLKSVLPSAVIVLIAGVFACPGVALARDLTFAQRVEAQRAIERVYYIHHSGGARLRGSGPRRAPGGESAHLPRRVGRARGVLGHAGNGHDAAARGREDDRREPAARTAERNPRGARKRRTPGGRDAG